MFEDKPHRLNERTSAQRFCVLTILPPVAALAVGLPAQRAIAQRFRALALFRHGWIAIERRLSGAKADTGANRHSITFDPRNLRASKPMSVLGRRAEDICSC